MLGRTRGRWGSAGRPPGSGGAAEPVGEQQVRPEEGLGGPRSGSTPWRDISVPVSSTAVKWAS